MPMLSDLPNREAARMWAERNPYPTPERVLLAYADGVLKTEAEWREADINWEAAAHRLVNLIYESDVSVSRDEFWDYAVRESVAIVEAALNIGESDE